MSAVIFICGNFFLWITGKTAKIAKFRTRKNFVPHGSRSVDIEDRMYVFTLFVALNDDLWLRKLWLQKRLCQFFMKLLI